MTFFCGWLRASTRRQWCAGAASLLLLASLTSCSKRPANPRTVVMIIESSPNNLDLRQGTDAQSERVGGVIFDALVKKDEHYNLRPWLATHWEQPDPLTLAARQGNGARANDGVITFRKR